MTKWEIAPLHKVALFLFPKFKRLSILPISIASDVPQLVREMLRQMRFRNGHARTVTVSDHQYTDVDAYQPSSSKQRRIGNADQFAFDLDHYLDQPEECADDIESEVTRYMQADFSSQDQFFAKDQVGSFSILKFWHEQKQYLFPCVAELARYILSTPCSSAASERLFSCAGRDAGCMKNDEIGLGVIH